MFAGRRRGIRHTPEYRDTTDVDALKVAERGAREGGVVVVHGHPR
jgi:hypothetical protein